MFGIKLPWTTKIEEDPEKIKTEQQPLESIQEPETKVVDIHGTINFISLYDDSFSSAKELIQTYREMSTNFEVSEALDEIENDAIVFEDNECVSLDLDNTELSENIKKKIYEEFDYILELLDWNNEANNLFKQWYIDGRLYFQNVMKSNPKLGLEKLVKLDPLIIKRMKSKKDKKIYYEYDLKDDEKNEQLKIIPGEGVNFIHSGILDSTHSYYISELHKSIRPLNNLRLMEDSALIYYITRAPSKRVFYIDIGNSPTKKGEEKVKKIMNNFKNRISYDSVSGKIVQQKRSIPVNEDLWLATRGDLRGTKIDYLQGDTNLLDPEILAYYKKKFYKSMGVPYARIDEDSGASIDFGGNAEFTRQELKMAKQTSKRRRRFSPIFLDPLKVQLISKKILTIEEWESNINKFIVNWKNDSYMTMIKQNEVLNKQIELANEIEPFIGKYFSHEYVRKKIFRQTDDVIEKYDKQIEEEKNNDKYKQAEQEPEI